MINEKYRMFTNFLYNELGITKEDIKEWTKQAVTEVAERFVQHEFSTRPLDIRIQNIIRQYPDSGQVQRHIADILAKQLEIKIKE